MDRERQSTGRGQLKEYTIERRFKQPARSIIHCGSFYLFENGLSEDGLHALARVVVTQMKSDESEGQTGSFLMGCREAGIPDFKFHRLSIQWMANQARIAVPPIKYRPGKRNN